MLKKMLPGWREYKVVAGIGLLSLMREIAEAGVNELIECGELKPKDAKDIVDSLVQRSEEKKRQYEAWLAIKSNKLCMNPTSQRKKIWKS